MTESSQQSSRQIARAAGTVMFAYVLSNLTGLIRQMLVSNTFGTGKELDAFYAAVTIPDLLFNLLAGGALASAFIPIFTETLHKEDTGRAFGLFSAITSLILLILGAASVITVVFAPGIVNSILYAFDPSLDGSTRELSIALLRVIMIAPTVFGISGIVMGVLNTHQKFLVPSLAPVVNWAGWIIGIIFFVPSMGIFGLAWGYVLGAILHLGIQIPSLLRIERFVYSPLKGLGEPSVLKVLALVGPRLLGVGAVQVNFLINTMIAAGLEPGSLSAINIGRMVMTMPLFVIAQAIATAALPTFSAQVAKGQNSAMMTSLVSTLRGVLLLSLPAAVGMILLRQPITILLFQRGQFDERSTELVSWAILWFTSGLVGHALVEILSRAFYALHDTKTPVTIGVVAMGLNIIFSFLFSGWFRELGYFPLGGLALANSAATAIEAVLLLVWIRRRLGVFDLKSLLVGMLQFTVVSISMGLAIFGWLVVSANTGLLFQLLVAIVLGVAVFFIGVMVAKVPEARMFAEFALNKVHGKTTS